MTEQEQLYRPIAPWTGRLVLPKPEERTPDGGVFIDVENTPESHRSLLGKRCRLTWKMGTAFSRIIGEQTADINFTREAAAGSDRGTIHPDRIKGWRNASPLETLAGARKEDDVRVSLKDVTAVYTPGMAILQTGEDPLQIAGVRMALIAFLGQTPVAGDSYPVRHYNPRTEKFDGPAGTVRFGAFPHGESPASPEAAAWKILLSELNDHGWYVFGSIQDGIFTVEALEPRRLHLLKPTEYRYDSASSRDFIEREALTGRVGSAFRIALLDCTTPERITAGDQIKTSSFREGDSGLLLHLDGGFADKAGYGSPAREQWRLSCGSASVKRDPFTGDLRWSVVYTPVLGPNPDGIAAGPHSWHSLMGRLASGSMFRGPLLDAVLIDPSFTFSYRFGTISFMPLREIEKEFFKLTGMTRSGYGSDHVPLNGMESGSQDIAMALHSLWSRMKQAYFSDKKILRWTGKNRNTPQALLFHRLKRIVIRWDSWITPFIVIPSRWKHYMRSIPYRRVTGKIGEKIDGLITFRTASAAGFFKAAAGLFIDDGSRLWLINTGGGDTPENRGKGPVPGDQN